MRCFRSQMRCIWFQILDFLVLHETLHFDKHESADFKYDNKLLKLLPETPKEDSFVPKCKDF